MKNKKGIINKLSALTLGILTLAIIISVGIIILGTFAGNVGVCNQDIATTTTNNLAGYINNTGFQLTGGTYPGFTMITLIALNHTDGVTIDSGEYIISVTGLIKNATEVVYDDAIFNYTFTWSDPHDLDKTTLTCLNSSGGLW